jgi:hypothetical protein
MNREKTYNEKLQDMTYKELEKELERNKDGQNNSHSDIFWWSWESQMDAIGMTQLNTMKRQVDILLQRYGAKRVIEYADKVVKAKRLEAEAEKAKKEL